MVNFIWPYFKLAKKHFLISYFAMNRTYVKMKHVEKTIRLKMVLTKKWFFISAIKRYFSHYSSDISYTWFWTSITLHLISKFFLLSNLYSNKSAMIIIWRIAYEYLSYGKLKPTSKLADKKFRLHSSKCSRTIEFMGNKSQTFWNVKMHRQ